MKKRPVKKQSTQKTKSKTQNKKRVLINFLEKPKDVTDKFRDVLDRNTEKIFSEDQDGGIHFRRGGKKEFAKKLGTSTAQITKWEKFGVDPSKLTDKTKKTLDKVKKLWNEKKKLLNEKTGKYEYKRVFANTKKETKQFSKHSFTRKNFFHRKKLPKRKKNQQYYFRCGLYLKFNNGYTISNLPVSHYDFKGYPEGYEAMWNLIRATIAQYDSLVFFRINYFDVSIINL